MRMKLLAGSTIRDVRSERIVPQSHRVFRAFAVQPHRTKNFKLSSDPFFIESPRCGGLYLNPPGHAIVLSVDENSQIQALDRTQPVLPMDWVMWKE